MIINNRSDRFKKIFIEIFLEDYLDIKLFSFFNIKIIGFKCFQMWSNQREFLNGVVRRFRPKKFVEIGVAQGCGSSIILIFVKCNSKYE